MTPQETIETMKIAIAEVEWNYPMGYAVAFENAIKSLEKQIPKKVELYTNDGNFKWKNYPCPCCREMLGLNVNKRYIKFCPYCGQALDWSDTE